MNHSRYIYIRISEVEGRHPQDAGAWQITSLRLIIGEGVPSPDDPLLLEADDKVIDVDKLPPTPKIPRSRLHGGQIPWYYRRLRNSDEVVRYLLTVGNKVPVSLRLCPAWLSPPGGVIPLPDDDEPILPTTHNVVITECDNNTRLFKFDNWWGQDWGDQGNGYISFDYINKFSFYIFALYDLRGSFQSNERRNSGIRHIHWTKRDEWHRRVYGFELRDGHHDRLAWSFVVEKDGGLEVEELYVRPEYRGRGLGKTLSKKLVTLARAKDRPMRLWIPFADTKGENSANYEPLVAIVRDMDLDFRRCPVPWAAYLASNEQTSEETSRFPLEPSWFPERPRSTLAVLKVAVATAAMSVVTTRPNIGDPQQSYQPQSGDYKNNSNESKNMVPEMPIIPKSPSFSKEEAGYQRSPLATEVGDAEDARLAQIAWEIMPTPAELERMRAKLPTLTIDYSKEEDIAC